MDWQVDGFGEIPLSFFCNYVCDSCRESDRCILYAFERLGRKVGLFHEIDNHDYWQIADEIQRNLGITIKSVKDKAKGLSGESQTGIVNGSSRSRNPALSAVMLMSREFSNKAYELLQDIKMQEEIPLSLLPPLRELQMHHTLVTTKLCRAMAALLSAAAEEQDPKPSAEEVIKSLEICVNALMHIAKAIRKNKILLQSL